jgi:hypothetical protein
VRQSGLGHDFLQCIRSRNEHGFVELGGCWRQERYEERNKRGEFAVSYPQSALITGNPVAAYFPGRVCIQATRHFKADSSCRVDIFSLGWAMELVMAWTTIGTESNSVCCICILDAMVNIYMDRASKYPPILAQKISGIYFLSDDREKVQDMLCGHSAA